MIQVQKFRGLFLSLIIFVIVVGSAFFVSAQTVPVVPMTVKPVSTPKPTPKPYYDKEKEKSKESKTKTRIENESDTPAEKFLKVDPKVNVSFCVSEGNVKVNGWDRNEIRAYVSGGSQVGYKISEKSKQTGAPVWVYVVGFDPGKNTDPRADECLSGDDIELDVPRNATITFKSRESGVTIESVGKAIVENVSGDICLTNITNGIRATTYQGTVTVGKSSGAMVLTTTEGNIVAYEVSPSEIGDVFKAKTTNGMITLDDIAQRQLDVNSISGSIKFTGNFLSGGQYNFSTSSGLLLLLVPEKVSCTVSAILTYGTYHSEISPITEIISNPNGIKTVSATFGKGEAELSLKTVSGRINIKKQ